MLQRPFPCHDGSPGVIDVTADQGRQLLSPAIDEAAVTGGGDKSREAPQHGFGMEEAIPGTGRKILQQHGETIDRLQTISCDLDPMRNPGKTHWTRPPNR